MRAILRARARASCGAGGGLLRCSRSRLARAARRAGTLTACMVVLYQKNIVDAPALMAWKDDLKDTTPGKSVAIIGTRGFFSKLEVCACVRARGGGVASARPV